MKAVDVRPHYEPDTEAHLLSLEAVEIVKNIKYKDWKFRIEHNRSSIEVIITVFCKCSRTGSYIEQNFMQGFVAMSFNCFRDESFEDMFLIWLFDFILKIERHEACELFKYKGEMINDPHITPYDGTF